MENKICSYELLFVVNGNLGEDSYTAIKDKFVALINGASSDVTVNEWGKRRLAYPINYVGEGYYVLVCFKSQPDFPRELERVLGITEGVLRYMTVTKEAVEAEAAKAPVAEATEEASAVEATETVADTTEE